MTKYRLAILVEFEADSYTNAVGRANGMTSAIAQNYSSAKIVDTVGPDISSPGSALRDNTVTFPRAENFFKMPAPVCGICGATQGCDCYTRT